MWLTNSQTANSFCCLQESVDDEISGSGEEKAKTSIFSEYKWSHGKTAGKRGLCPNNFKYLDLAIFEGDGDAPAIEDEVCIKDGEIEREHVSGEIFSKFPKLYLGLKASKARIVDKPWKFSTKNVDECNICSNELFSICHPHISRCTSIICPTGENVFSSTQHSWDNQGWRWRKLLLHHLPVNSRPTRASSKKKKSGDRLLHPPQHLGGGVLQARLPHWLWLHHRRPNPRCACLLPSAVYEHHWTDGHCDWLLPWQRTHPRHRFWHHICISVFGEDNTGAKPRQ